MHTNTSAHIYWRRHYVLYAHDTIHSCFSQGSKNVILILPPQYTQHTKAHIIIGKTSESVSHFLYPKWNTM